MAYLGDTSTPKLWKRMKAYINNRIANLEQGITEELIWQNANPTSEFPSQTINLDLSDYDGVKVIARSTPGTNYHYKFEVKVGNTKRALAPAGSEFKMSIREISVSTSSVYFGKGYYVNTYTAGTENNAYLIPYEIYGIKGGN